MVFIIIVLYNPTKEQIDHIKSLSCYHRVIAVDNTSISSNRIYTFTDSPNIVYIGLGANFGIAYAQNIGIRKAMDFGCDYVIFLDQDSDASSSLINGLLISYKGLMNIGKKVASIGPLIMNKSTGRPYKNGADLNKRYTEVDFVISSGSIVGIEVFKEVGLMIDNLFIDTVDMEWCWRARNKGYQNFMDTSLRMFHKVGEADRSVFGFPILLSKPFRYYYVYRNFFLLCRLNYIPFTWKVKGFIRRVFCLIYIPFVSSSNSKEILRFMLRGIKDGLKNKKLSCSQL